jgi:cytochrome oxidase Cu insertion factor (SCO1/SenC/PrrC family)
MDERATSRRKLIATLAVVLPIAAGLVIAAIAHFVGGGETDIQKPRPQQQHRLVEAATPAAAGSPAPRVRVTEGGSGKSFDGSTLGGEPYAVLFISTRCEAIGGFLHRVAAELEAGEAAVLAISADPRIDSPGAVRSWLSRNRIEPGGSVHYLTGDEHELRGYWNVWSFDGPAAKCTDSLPAHLVSATDKNAGVLDVAPDSPASLLTEPLRGMAK